MCVYISRIHIDIWNKLLLCIFIPINLRGLFLYNSCKLALLYITAVLNTRELSSFLLVIHSLNKFACIHRYDRLCVQFLPFWYWFFFLIFFSLKTIFLLILPLYSSASQTLQIQIHRLPNSSATQLVFMKELGRSKAGSAACPLFTCICLTSSSPPSL